LCSLPARRFRERQKWAQPITIDALGHLTLGFHHRSSTNGMISINDKRANQLLSSSLIGLTKQQGVMFQVPSWKPRGQRWHWLCQDFALPISTGKVNIEMDRRQASYKVCSIEICTVLRFFRAIWLYFAYNNSVCNTKNFEPSSQAIVFKFRRSCIPIAKTSSTHWVGVGKGR
jgi:hypothetical protein